MFALAVLFYLFVTSWANRLCTWEFPEDDVRVQEELMRGYNDGLTVMVTVLSACGEEKIVAVEAMDGSHPNNYQYVASYGFLIVDDRLVA